MSLVLRGVSLDDEPMSRPLIGRFDERGGSIGRSDSATFTLPDPERTVSRIQAQILFSENGFWIENVSGVNPIVHNGRPLSSGMRVALRMDDELKIGGYKLQVAYESDEASATILRGRTVAPTIPPAPPVPPIAPAVGPTPVAFEATAAAPAPPPNRNAQGDHPALRNALKDLQFQQAGAPTWMRAALAGVLEGFEPMQLETQLRARSGVDSSAPSQHGADLWELYVEHYESLRQDSQEIFDRLFSAAFVEAYAARVSGLDLAGDDHDSGA